MLTMKKWTSCKFLAVLLSVFFVMEAHALAAQQNAAQEEQWAAQFQLAKEAYFGADYENAKTILEKLTADLESVAGRDSFKGQVYLLAGAAYEKLDVLDLSVKYYCRAKERLGEGKTIEGLDLKDLKYYGSNCQALASLFMAGIMVEGDALQTDYNRARLAYFAFAYEPAKTILEKLISDLGPIQGRDTFKGQVFLLAGATYEMLKFKELSIKYFCRAKAVLGEGKTIEGLVLKDFKYYREDCAGGAVIAGAVAAPRKKSFLGGLLGTLLFLTVLGAAAYYIYTKYIKKSSDSGTDTTTFTSACFSTTWHFVIDSVWSGSVGTVTLTPSDQAPQPNETNGWDNSVTYTLSTSGGGTLTSISLKLSVTVGGGDNGIRHDLAYMDGAQILDVTNTFTQSCSAPGSKDYNDLYQRNSTGSFTLRHKVELSKAQAVSSHLTITKR